MCSQELMLRLLLICILMFKVSLTEDDVKFETYYRKEHSIVKPYQIRGMDIPNWDYTGGTLITTEFIRLTPDRQTRTGK